MKCDVLIIGAGPAGLSAGIFACRAGLKTVCMEKLGVGGQASLTADIVNYPGFLSVSGFDLTDNMRRQAESFGMELVYSDVQKLCKEKNHFVARTKNDEIVAKKVIIASGCKVRKLGLDKEELLTGKGVSYCASCDGGFFKNKVVAVVGGGNTAIGDVNYLSKICKKVYLIHLSDNFKASAVDLNKAKKSKNVEIVTFANVKELFGTQYLTGINVDVNGEMKKLDVDALFIAIGSVPDTDFIELDIQKDSFGYIVVDNNMQTNIKNCFAAGDVTNKGFRQVVTSVADGARAGNSCIGV